MFYANYMRERMKNLPKYDEAEGNPAEICNSLKRPVRDMNIFGESTQVGTPTPDTPVDIVSVENPTVVVRGKNLFDWSNSKAFWDAGAQGTRVENGVKVYSNTTDSYRFVAYTIPNSELIRGHVVQVSGDIMTSSESTCAILVGYKIANPSRFVYGGNSKDILSPDGFTRVNFKFNVPDIPPEEVQSGSYMIMFSFNRWGSALTDPSNSWGIFRNIQIEFGDTSTEYEPYKAEQNVILDGITLRGLKSTDGTWAARDEIVVDGKKKAVKLVKRCWEIELGADGVWWHWRAYDSVKGYEGFMAGGAGALPESYTRRTPALCNQCRVGYGTMWLGIEGKAVYMVGPEARQFYDATLEDKGLANFKAHLDANPLKIVSYYTNPIETDITNTEAGQKLLELYTNKGTTNIFLNSESDLGEISVRYVRK
jgi:hypothetical protein